MLTAALLLVFLLSSWLVLRARLVARLDQAMGQHGWVPVAHPLAQLWTLAFHSSLWPSRRGEASVQLRARRHAPARSRPVGAGCSESGKNEKDKAPRDTPMASGFQKTDPAVTATLK